MTKEYNKFKVIKNEDKIRLTPRNKITFSNRFNHHKYINNRKERKIYTLHKHNNWKEITQFNLEYIELATVADFSEVDYKDLTFVFRTVNDTLISVPLNEGNIPKIIFDNFHPSYMRTSYPQSYVGTHLADFISIVLYELYTHAGDITRKIQEVVLPVNKLVIDQQDYYFHLNSLQHNQIVISVTNADGEPIDINNWSLNTDYQVVTGEQVYDLRVIYSDIINDDKDHIQINDETIKQIREYNITGNNITLTFTDNTFTFEPLKVLLINIHNETEEIQLTRIIRVQLDNNAIITPTVPESDDNELITLPTTEKQESTPEQKTLGNGLTPYFLGHYTLANSNSTNFFVSFEDEQGNQYIADNITSNEGTHTLKLNGGDIQLKLYSKGSNDTEYQQINTTCKVVYDQEAGNYFALTYPEYNGEKIQIVAENTSTTLYHTGAITDENKDVHIVFITTPEESDPLQEQTVPTTRNIITETTQTYLGSEETYEGYQFHFSIVHSSPLDVTQLLPAAESVEQIDTTRACLDYGSDYDSVYIELMNAAHSSMPFESRIETSSVNGTSYTHVFLDVSASAVDVGDSFTIILSSDEVTSSVGVTVANGSVSHAEQFTKTN